MNVGDIKVLCLYSTAGERRCQRRKTNRWIEPHIFVSPEKTTNRTSTDVDVRGVTSLYNQVGCTHTTVYKIVTSWCLSQRKIMNACILMHASYYIFTFTIGDVFRNMSYHTFPNNTCTNSATSLKHAILTNTYNILRQLYVLPLALLQVN